MLRKHCPGINLFLFTVEKRKSSKQGRSNSIFEYSPDCDRPRQKPWKVLAKAALFPDGTKSDKNIAAEIRRGIVSFSLAYINDGVKVVDCPQAL